MLLVLTSVLIISLAGSAYNNELGSQDKLSFMSNIGRDSILTFGLNNTKTDDLCDSWAIQADQLGAFMESFESIDKYEWNQCYGVFSCSAKGELIYEDEKYNYELNAGGWLYLFNKNKELYLGSKIASDSVFFISTNFCDQEWD